jgi:hypothetical protein
MASISAPSKWMSSGISVKVVVLFESMPNELLFASSPSPKKRRAERGRRNSQAANHKWRVGLKGFASRAGIWTCRGGIAKIQEVARRRRYDLWRYGYQRRRTIQARFVDVSDSVSSSHDASWTSK